MTTDKKDPTGLSELTRAISDLNAVEQIQESGAPKKPIEQRVPRYTLRRIEPAVLVVPAPEGTNVYHECPSDEEAKTLLADGPSELTVEKVLAFAIYRMERTHPDGFVDWTHDTYPIGLHGDIDHYDYMVFADGVVEYGNDTLQSNRERLALLRAKLAFEQAARE